MTLTTGIHGEQSVAVTNENTAKTMGSGTQEFFNRLVNNLLRYLR